MARSAPDMIPVSIIISVSSPSSTHLRASSIVCTPFTTTTGENGDSRGNVFGENLAFWNGSLGVEGTEVLFIHARRRTGHQRHPRGMRLRLRHRAWPATQPLPRCRNSCDSRLGTPHGVHEGGQCTRQPWPKTAGEAVVSIRQPSRKLGHTAVDFLLARVADPTAGAQGPLGLHDSVQSPHLRTKAPSPFDVRLDIHLGVKRSHCFESDLCWDSERHRPSGHLDPARHQRGGAH